MYKVRGALVKNRYLVGVDMPISYRPLFHLLVDRGMKKTDLIEKVGISRMTVAKFSKNEYVAAEVIEKLCLYFKCQPNDIFEVIEDKPE